METSYPIRNTGISNSWAAILGIVKVTYTVVFATALVPVSSPVCGTILPNKECRDQQQQSCDDEGEAAHGGHVVPIDDVERRRTDEQSNALNAANSSKQSPCCEGINSHQQVQAYSIQRVGRICGYHPFLMLS